MPAYFNLAKNQDIPVILYCYLPRLIIPSFLVVFGDIFTSLEKLSSQAQKRQLSCFLP